MKVWKGEQRGAGDGGGGGSRTEPGKPDTELLWWKTYDIGNSVIDNFVAEEELNYRLTLSSVPSQSVSSQNVVFNMDSAQLLSSRVTCHGVVRVVLFIRLFLFVCLLALFVFVFIFVCLFVLFLVQ